MRIHSIELNNVRGVRHLRADNFPDTGVIVIHGGNEAGKSTILDALGIALLERAGSTAKTARDKTLSDRGVMWLKPVDVDEAPEVTVSMSIGPYDFKLYKRFIKGSKTELEITSPKHESLTGPDAQARLDEIIAEHLDKALLATLFLRQDQLDEGIAAAGVPSLTAALERETGTDAETSLGDDTDLMRRVSDEFRRYYTEKGRASGELNKAEKNHEACVDASAQKQKKVDELAGFVDSHARANDKLERAREDLPEARSVLEEREASAAKATQMAAAVEQQRQGVERARLDSERADQDLARREELRSNLEEYETQLKTAVEAVAAAETAAREEEETVEDLTAALTKAKAVRDEARTARDAVRVAAEHAQDRQRLAQLRERVSELDGLDAAVKDAREVAAARGRVITDADVTRAEKASNEVELAASLREQAAAKLILRSGKDSSVTVDGEERALPADEDVTVALDNGTVLDIAGISARFDAGAAASGDARAREDKARAALADILQELECVDVDEVRATRDAHREVGEHLSRAEADLRSALRGEELGDLRAQLGALETQLEVAAAGVKDTAEELSVAEAEEARKETHDAFETADAEVDKAAARLEPLQRRQAQAELIAVQQNEKAVRENVERAQKAVAAAAEADSVKDLQAAAEAAKTALSELEEQLETAERELADNDPTLAQKLVVGAQTRVETLENTISTAEKEMLRMESYISAASGAAEELELALAAEELAQQKLAAVQRRAAAVRRLYEVLQEHQTAARQRYAAPFADRLGQLARSLFGGDITFDLDEELRIASRTRGGVTVDLDALSGGAKEQLGILTRLAIADMVGDDAEGGREPNAGVPVIIDDALGSTDSQRLELMSTIFADAGRHSQVIVLTCMPERYEWIPGRVEFDIEDLKRVPLAGR
ncbi:AAA family ATPase [Corynebacterium phoceense]|uniref:AAA family ATPase n=1 Tax=Corynebacterium phoceense TaxID=1686286 RepID=UPI00211BE775|nr:AAA family ATPase [Corynebacterium phoceense]MCQ9346551.1 AAA family ATPase [Corynebacterium phoceense]